MKMQNASLNHICPPRLKNFFRKLCVVSARRAKKEHIASDLDTQFERLSFHHSLNGGRTNLEKKRGDRTSVSERASHRSLSGGVSSLFDNETERELRIRIKQLEEGLRKAVEEKGSSLKENRNKIHELSIALLSIKAEAGRLIEAKEERERRISHIEKRIKRVG